MKLTTDRHEASRGLFATAQLLVDIAHVDVDATRSGLKFRRYITVYAAINLGLLGDREMHIIVLPFQKVNKVVCVCKPGVGT